MGTTILPWTRSSKQPFSLELDQGSKQPFSLELDQGNDAIFIGHDQGKDIISLGHDQENYLSS